ncbi:MAG: hypothetical protein M3303_14200 [Gemmatimonadota bacterium]|nr:hypothetical protein [Gemmatimonadota bacterium]
MSSRHAQALCGLILILAGCAEPATSRSIAAPDAAPTLDAAALADIPLTDLASDEELAVVADVATDRAATGGRAVGHAEITVSTAPTSPTQRLSFTALSVGAFPSAKGQAEVHILSSLGLTDVHAAVDCLVIVGNTASVSGPVTKFRRNGEDLPFPPGFQMRFRVQDNGEGGTAVDMASLIVGNIVPQFCLRPALLLVPSDNGDIQVSQP